MVERRDTDGMTERQILSEIYGKVEILDDIVRGDKDRGTQGLQDEFKDLKEHIKGIEHDIGQFKQAKLVRQTVITSVASLITVLASLATIISLAWQGSGG
jgi:hypothetical protein